MLLSLLVPVAFACGGFVPTEGALVASDAQQAVFEIGTDSVTVTYRARYVGNAADFAWVLAVPGAITDVAEGDPALIDAVALASAPQVELDPKSDDGCGCGSSAGLRSKGDAGNFGGDTGVEVTGTGFAGDFEYTTLSATDADSLSTWLTDHGYDVSLLSDALEAYVADPIGYEFVAVQLAPDVAQTPEGGVELDPLRITYGAGADGALHTVFPARLGRTATVEEVRTELFVLATGTATLSGWEAVANPDETDGETWDILGADYWDPSGMYYQHLLRLGGDQRRMWLAYAGPFRTETGERWLTRYDAVVHPDANVVDPVFTDSGERTEATTIIYLQDETTYERTHEDTGAWIVPVGLLAGAGLRRRRNRRSEA